MSHAHALGYILKSSLSPKLQLPVSQFPYVWSKVAALLPQHPRAITANSSPGFWSVSGAHREWPTIPGSPPLGTTSGSTCGGSKKNLQVFISQTIQHRWYPCDSAYPSADVKSFSHETQAFLRDCVSIGVKNRPTCPLAHHGIPSLAQETLLDSSPPRQAAHHHAIATNAQQGETETLTLEGGTLHMEGDRSTRSNMRSPF